MSVVARLPVTKGAKLSALEFIDLKSFWSVWYWIFSVVTWSMLSHWTLGVPFDMLIRAERKGGVFAEHCDALIEINMARLIYYFDLGGVYMAGFVGFILSALATLGFMLRVEIFLAIFVLAFPTMIITAFGVRFAYIARDAGWQGAQLRQKLRWRRTWNQVIGMIATVFASAIAVWSYLQTINPMWENI